MLDERVQILGVLLLAWGAYSYINDIYQDSAQPNLVTWFLWTLAPMIAFAAQIQSGVGSVAILTLAVGLCPLAVFLAGLRKGTFRPSRFDLACGGASVLALLLWQLTGSGAVAVALSIAADSLAAVPTLRKAYSSPQSESPFLFMLFALSATLALLTINTWTLESGGFAMYILILYVVLFVLVKFRLGERIRMTSWLQNSEQESELPEEI